MVVNCPKCNLLQPEDEYCARCGINMKTWSPPKKPFWKKVLGNWMVQLLLLFFIILIVVISDNFSNQPPPPQEPPPVNFNNRPQADQQTEPTQEQDVVEVEVKRPIRRESEERQVPPTQTQKAAAPQKENQFAPTKEEFEKVVSIRLITITRPATDRLMQLAQKVDETSIIVSQKKAQDFLKENKSEIAIIGGTSKKFEFEQPVTLFLGEQDLESGIDLGFYTQVKVDQNSRPEAINAEIQFWHQLKLAEEGGGALTYNINIPKEAVLFIVDPSVHDYQFTEEERTLFEASRKLQDLNNEAFIESLSDIALVLSIR